MFQKPHISPLPSPHLFHLFPLTCFNLPASPHLLPLTCFSRDGEPYSKERAHYDEDMEGAQQDEPQVGFTSRSNLFSYTQLVS